ncbi:MAG: hypothetical protein ACLUYS_09775, partial [Allobaculum sp.]|uniref:hypothetical protein n=1 Tax=Allobaculum sp. TaxID=1872463 RepID=UPI00399B7220
YPKEAVEKIPVFYLTLTLDRMDWRATSVCARFKGVIYVWIPVGGFLQRNLERAVSIRKMQ